MQLTMGPFTQKHFFSKPHIFKNVLEKNNNTKPSSKNFQFTTEMLQMTENDVVPIPALVWCREFTP